MTPYEQGYVNMLTKLGGASRQKIWDLFIKRVAQQVPKGTRLAHFARVKAIDQLAKQYPRAAVKAQITRPGSVIPDEGIWRILEPARRLAERL